MPEPSRGKRRRATQMQRRADRVGAPAKPKPNTAPVGGTTVSSRMPASWWLAAGVIAVVAIVAVIVILRLGPSTPVVGAAASPSPGASSNASPGSSAAAGTCPTSQPAALPAGQTQNRDADHPEGPDGPQGRSGPVADRGRQLRRPCVLRLSTTGRRSTARPRSRTAHRSSSRVATDRNGPGGPGYTIQDETVTHVQARHGRDGQVPRAELVGSQFFIVLDDKDARSCWPGTTPTRSSAT